MDTTVCRFEGIDKVRSEESSRFQSADQTQPTRARHRHPNRTR
jgi:hypothetical protein